MNNENLVAEHHKQERQIYRPIHSAELEAMPFDTYLGKIAQWQLFKSVVKDYVVKLCNNRESTANSLASSVTFSIRLVS